MSPYDDRALYAIRPDGQGRLLVVGRRGTPFISSDWGRTWSIVDRTIARHVWALVAFGSPTKLLGLGEPSGMALSDDGGVNWSNATGLVHKPMFGLFAASHSDHLWAVGDGGMLLISEDGGRSWEERSIGDGRRLLGIRGLPNGSTLWAVGEGGLLLKSSDFGRSWHPRSTGTAETLRSVFVDTTGRHVSVAGDGGTVLQSSDAGESWERRTSASNAHLYSIAGSADGSTLWSCGTAGTIVASTDAGRTWHLQVSGISTDLWVVTVAEDGKCAWAAGQAGVLVESMDGGINWNRLPTGSSENLWAIAKDERAGLIWVAGDSSAMLRGDTRVPLPLVGSAQIVQRGGRVRTSVTMAGDYDPGSLKLSLAVANRSTWSVGYFASVGEADFKGSRSADLEFDPTNVGIKPGDQLFIRMDLRTGDFVRAVVLGPVSYDSFAWLRTNRRSLIPAGAYLVLLTGVVTLYWTWPRALWLLYCWLKRRKEEVSSVARGSLWWVGLASYVPLAAAFLPVVVSRRRVLDDWVSANAEKVLKQFRADAHDRGVGYYVPLPLVTESDATGSTICDRPSSKALRANASARFIVEVRGDGGVGKTTLAFQIGFWAGLPSRDERLLPERSLPVLIDEDTTDLVGAVTRKLAAISSEDVPRDFVHRLLRRGRLTVLWDRVSERSESSKAYLSRYASTLGLQSLVWTTRSAIQVDGVSPLVLKPRPVDEYVLLYFVQAILQHESEGEPIPVEQQLELSRKLVELLKGQGTEATSPLLVRLYVTRALALLKERGSLDELPLSVPDLYVDFVRRMIGPAELGGPPPEETVNMAKAIAHRSLGDDFVPREVLQTDVLAVVATPSPSNGERSLERLTQSGLLLGRDTGVGRFVRFKMDPVAECLAAIRTCELCGVDVGAWKALADRLEVSPAQACGFRRMIELCCLAYGRTFGWPWREGGLGGAPSSSETIDGH